MGKRVARLLLGVAVAGSLLVSSPSATAQLAAQPFAAYGNATAVALNALQLGETQVANTQVANSAGVVNSTGLNTTVNNQFGQPVGPAQPGKNAYGRGSGVEVGLLTPTVPEDNVNQIVLTQVAEANAAPPTPLVTEETAIDLAPALTASTARGQAQATYDPNFCPVGRPLSFGLGYVENLQVLPGELGSLLGTATEDNAVSQTRTVTYMIPNGDGTYGVVAESEAIVAPVAVAGTGVTIEIAGPIGFRVTATGKPGDPRNGVEYTGTPVLNVRLGAVTLLSLSLQDLLGAGGVDLPVPPLLNLQLGTPPEGLDGTGSPAVAADGTSASGSADTLRLQLLEIPGVSALDVALGHFEGAVSVPAGGVTCNLPVSKVATPDPVQVGEDVVFTINIPSDPGLFNALFACDLVDIRAQDTVGVASGTVNFTILSASNGGVIGPPNVVTWEDLGSYALGDPPIQPSLTVRINSASGDAVIRDVVDVSANLSNCRGRAAGDDLVLGSGFIEGNAIVGQFVLDAPTISGGNLAATGGTSAPLVLGGALVLGGLGLIRVRRSLLQRR